MRTLILLLAALPCVHADSLRRELRHEDSCTWEARFRSGCVSVPCGATRGTVLSAPGHFPKLKARIQGSVWKGKTFHGDTIINRWIGFEAVTASVCTGTSILDGQPCLVMQYAANAKMFPNVRDELREIAPGTWLGRCYDSSTGQFKGYFLLQSP